MPYRLLTIKDVWQELAYPLNNEPENLMIWKKNIFYNRLFVIFNGNLEEIHCSQHFLFQIPYFGFSELNLDDVYCFYFRYYWVVVLELEIGADGKPKSPSKAPSDYNRTEIKTYEEYLIERGKGSIVPYIAGYFTTFPQDGLFIIGNDTTFKVKKRKRRNTRTTSYRNGPLIADTSYVVFQRAFVTDVSLFISLA